MRLPGAAARLPPPLPPGARRPTPAISASALDAGGRRRAALPPSSKSRLRRSGGFMAGGFLLFIAILTYFLVATHHLTFPSFSSSPAKGAAAPAGVHGSKLEAVPLGGAGDAAALAAAAAATAKDAAHSAAAAQAQAERAAAEKAVADTAEKAVADAAALDATAAAKAVADAAAAEAAAAAAAVASKAAADTAAAVADKAAADKAAADKAAADVVAAAAITAAVNKAADKAAAAVAETTAVADTAAAANIKAAVAKAAAARATAEKVAASKAAAESAAAAGGVAGGSCPELTKELVQRRAKSNTIMLTATDWKIFETMGVNWMKHLAQWGVDYYLVAATDLRTAQFLATSTHHGAGEPPCFNFIEPGNAVVNQEYKYGDAHYKAATWRKVTVVERIVDWGFNVLHSDVDVIWFRDPLPYFLGPALQHVDIAVSTDLISTGNPEGDDGLEVNIHQHVNANTGVYFVKGSSGGQRFMADWAALRVKMGHDNDQIGLYTYVRSQRAVVNQQLRRMSLHNNTVQVGLLSAAMLLNGYSYFIPRLHEHNHKSLAVHLTWVPLSREGKFHRMRDGMLYHDPPEYYSEPRFLAADITYPVSPEGYNDWKDTEKMILFHLSAMDFQLRQLYRAMAMAVVLNRTLIVPRLKCYCYKNWFMMEQCRIPGDHVTQFPMDCALDQFLRPKVLYNYGAKLQSLSRPEPFPFTFREYTLLQNPRFPPELLQQQVVVEALPAGVAPPCPTCSLEKTAPDVLTDGPSVSLTLAYNASQTASLRFVSIGANLTEVPFKEALAKYADAPVLRFRNLTDVFGGITDPLLLRTFDGFVNNVTSNWCCRDIPFVKQGLKLKERLSIQW